MLIWYITLILLIVFLSIAISYEYFEAKTGVAVFPSMPGVRRKIIELLQKDRGERSESPYTILDLGSGSGQITWHIARAMPEAQVVGVELSMIPWLRSVLRQRLFGPPNLTYKRLDFWSFDTSFASAVITYLPGRIMDKVGEKLRHDLKPGTLILANTFPLRAGWEPVETLELHAPFKTTLSIYRA